MESPFCTSVVTRTLSVVALLVWSAAVPALSQPLVEASQSTQPESRRGGAGFYLEPVNARGSLFLPVDVAVAPDGRYFVAEKSGRVRVVMPDGTVQPEPFVDLSGEVYSDGDRGLLGIALHPDFETTPYVYLTYTVDEGPAPRPPTGFRAHARLTRYTASPSDPQVADPASRRVLLGETAATGIPACYNSHTIGTVLFGHDGSLFLGSGDAGSWAEADAGGLYDECFDGYVDPAQDRGSFRAQWTGSPAGKILRLDPETGLGLPDNPFYTGDPADWASRVWVLGLRNPFRYTVAPRADGEAGPGALYIGDVGQGTFEEINRARGGENFGWPCYEGPRVMPEFAEVEAPPGMDCALPREGVLTAPYAYFHHYVPDASAPSGRIASSITGGAFYEGTAYPERFRDGLFFADYSAGWIASGRTAEAALDAVEEVLTGGGPIVDIAYDPATETLVGVDIAAGAVVRIRHAGSGNVPPVARATASATQGLVPLRVDFSAVRTEGAGADLTYTWAFGTGDGAEGADVSYLYYQVGTYAATLTVTDASGARSQTVIPVRVGRSMPGLHIVEPERYVIGEGGAFRVAASASDSLEGPDDLQVSWAISLVHNEHEHPYFYTTAGAEGSFIVQPHASAGEVAYYRATATVVDREGLTVRADRTLREDNPHDIDVGGAARAEDGGFVFSRPLRVGRLALPLSRAVPDSLRVEARQGGVWQPVRYLHALPEADSLQLLFADVEADAFRVSAPGDTLDTPVRVFARLDPDATFEVPWSPADVGRPVAAGRTAPADGDAMVLVGGGTLRSGAYHFAPAPLTGDGAVTARVDAIDGGPAAGAGVAMRTALRDDAEGVGLFVGGEGTLRLQRGGGAVDTLAVRALPPPVWVRLRRLAEHVGAEISTDGDTWEMVWMGTLTPGAVLAGPAAVGGDREGEGLVALAWLDDVALETGPVAGPPSGTFAVGAPFPNPASGTVRLPITAGRTGGYEVRVFDTLGRLVQGPVRYDVSFPSFLTVSVDARALSVGAYLVHVTHLASGEARVKTLSVAR